MIIDIFHGHQFTLTTSDFLDQLPYQTIVNVRPVIADRLQVETVDTYGNSHTYVLPCYTPAHDAVKAKLSK